MGSLERVQFKFASIIGELCSEPLLLSQFAVWLDMKLAEYKAKGSISLDCSGEKPEPPWMKGVLPPSPASLPTSLFEKTQSSHSTPKSRSPFLQSSRQPVFPSNQKPNSYDPEMVECPVEDDEYIVVKEEHEDSSLYISQHHIDNTEQETADYIQSSSRKRLSNDGSNSGHLSKISRLAPTSSSPSTSSQSHIRASTETDLATSENILGSLGLTPSAELSERQNSWLGQVTADKEDNSTVARSAPAVPYSETNKRITSTRRNINAVVRNFQRWLERLPVRDDRRIEDIEASALDAYLAEFFTTVKKLTGGDYTPDSLSVYRSSLEKYLKEQNYPYSILFSSEFTKSQLAFKTRRLRLESGKAKANLT